MKHPRILVLANVVDRSHDLMGFLPGWIQALQDAGASVTTVVYGGDRNKIVRFRGALGELWRLRDTYDVVLVVMAPTWALMMAPFVRMMGKGIYLWYAVWRGSWKLRLAECEVNGIFSSVPEAFPFPSRKVHAIGQAIDTDRFSPDGAQRISGQVLFLGRISSVKRIELLFEAMSFDADKAWRAVIAGGPTSQKDRIYEQYLREMVSRLGLVDSVVWLGRVGHDSTHTLYRQADIVVNMTPVGSFDKTILEAMSSGAIVVASNPALRKFLSEAMAQQFMFRQDDSTDLARVLTGISNMSDHEKEDMRVAMRQVVVRHHSLSQWAQNIIKNLA